MPLINKRNAHYSSLVCYFRQIFLISCLSALVASFCFSLYQWHLINPIIFAAELYEQATPPGSNVIEQAWQY